MTESDDESRRLKAYPIGQRVLLSMMRINKPSDMLPSHEFVVLSGIDLPEDTTLKHVVMCYESNSLLCILHSKEFPIVPYGEILPRVSETLEYKVKRVGAICECGNELTCSNPKCSHSQV